MTGHASTTVTVEGRRSVSSAVVTATARALRDVNGVPEGVGVQVARRILSPEFWRWQARVAGAGFCTRPVRVTGQRYAQDAAGGRQVLYSTAGEPDRVLLIRCGNRRASVCPPCSREYKGDVWQLLHAGTAGGAKGVPASVGSHPMWFLTVTGPSFGSVHGAGCGGGRGGRSASGGRSGRPGDPTCGHGRGRTCPVVHAENNPAVGEPICPDCYDYPAAVAFNWAAPELWRRFTIAVKRRLAARLGITESALGKQVRISYAKVAEFQRRGIVHFHAIIRLDGAGEDYPTAHLGGLDTDDIAQVIRAAAADVHITAATSQTTQTELRFGDQIDIRPIRHPLPHDHDHPQDQDQDQDSRGGGGVTSGMVAAYIAKYATKAAEDFGLDSTIRSSTIAREAGLRPHIAARILTAEHLTQLPDYAGLHRWLHMLGFRGHFTTKSRRFSVTLGSLRQARRDHQARTHDTTGSADASGVPGVPPTTGPGGDGCAATPSVPDDWPAETAVHPAAEAADDSTVVIGSWRFLGLGYTTPGDALLAAHAHTDHQYARAMAREQRQTQEFQ